MKQRFFIIIGIIVLLAIVLGAYAASGPRSQSGLRGKTYVCAIDSDVGLQSIEIVNQNAQPQERIYLTIMDMPFRFNFTEGDSLFFNVTAISGYRFNAWLRDDGTFPSQNPLTIKALKAFSMTAHFLVVNEP